MADPTTTTPLADPKPADPKSARKTPKVKHLDGCPAKPGRVEQYDTDRVNRDHTTTPHEVTRCLDCGAHEVREK